MEWKEKTRPARASSPGFGQVCSRVFAKLAGRTGFADPFLLERWGVIAGPAIASLCRPGRLSGKGPGRTLEIMTENGAAATEVRMRTRELLARVNRYTGTGTVSRIVICQYGDAGQGPGPSAVPPGQFLSSFRAIVAGRNNTGGTQDG